MVWSVDETLMKMGNSRDARLRDCVVRLERGGWRATGPGEPDYPWRVDEELQTEAPKLMFLRGDPELFARPAVALIGTRRPSAEGAGAAAAYARALVGAGFSIVSGNAPGVDAASHEAALASGGETVVFAPVPPDQFSPSFKVGESAVGRMLVASRFAPQTEVRPWNFLARNALVAAHCRAAIIVETGARGGTLNTLKHLRAMGRPTFVLRLSPDNTRAQVVDMLVRGGVAELPLVQTDEALELVMERASQISPPKRRSLVPGDLFSESGEE
ncbi:hypothetical protein CVU37_12350 [candidate division BRC1 bacterium HGW-BRC1-1]|jgi:DNA processing protein|nr:MAG: hypothetical protein CVU37_12350 [candidate division BRC1 bacterium HGW-BRC1-1]